MVVHRSRTGCQTCRQRKLKCDEQRPICGQCTKSHRECVRSEGVTFRHHQNAAPNSEEMQADSLSNFYKYKNKFTDEQLKNFLPIPRELTFCIIRDPFAVNNEDEIHAGNHAHLPQTPDAYQQVAAHTLEALSTAAVDHPPYSAHAAHADFSSLYAAQVTTQTIYGGQRHGLSHPLQMTSLNLLTTQNSYTAFPLDPTLEATALAGIEQAAEFAHNRSPRMTSQDETGQLQESIADSKVSYILKNFPDIPNQ